MNKIKDNNVINEIYKDFMEKRNLYKIEIDNYRTELEILERSIEYSSRIEDTSKLFSPRNTDNIIDSLENLKLKRETTERLLDESMEQFDYYDNYYLKLKAIIEDQEMPGINDLIYSVGEENKVSDQELDIVDSDDNDSEGLPEDFTYSLNLNYNIDDTKEKLLNLSHKIDTCLKIFDNDSDRTKREIQSIGKTLNKIIRSLD